MLSLAANLNLYNREALLIGAGAVGRRKLRYLLNIGAKITVVEPFPEDWLIEHQNKGELTLIKEFSLHLLDKSPIVFIAMKEADNSLIDAVNERGLWLNVAGSPDLGNFTLPATIEEGDLRLTVSTGGASPALSAKIAKDLRVQFEGYGDFCELLKKLRPIILSSGLLEIERREKFYSLTESSALISLISKGHKSEALELVRSLMAPLTLPEGFTL
jgi:precorrin-2 dehydrogenase/sirohydrochlorin ferrochelatase